MTTWLPHCRRSLPLKSATSSSMCPLTPATLSSSNSSSVLASPKQHRLQQLFHSTELGDRKPTQLLRRMQQLLGDSATATDGTLLHELFLQRLPSNVRMVLASSSDAKSLEDIAQLADKIVNIAPPSMFSLAPSPSPSTTEVDNLRTEVTHLKELVSTLYPRGRSSQNRSPSPLRHPRSHSPPPANPGLCWYHAHFGDRAKNCTPPCSKSRNSPASR